MLNKVGNRIYQQFESLSSFLQVLQKFSSSFSLNPAAGREQNFLVSSAVSKLCLMRWSERMIQAELAMDLVFEAREGKSEKSKRGFASPPSKGDEREGWHKNVQVFPRNHWNVRFIIKLNLFCNFLNWTFNPTSTKFHNLHINVQNTRLHCRELLFEFCNLHFNKIVYFSIERVLC